MARSVADATRFTATGPYASTRSKKATTLNFTEPPPNETPQQKIRRLREASRLSKLAQVSRWDRIVERGRTIADRSHRVFTLTLIGFTGITLVYCTISTFDMLQYNRKKRKAFFEQQQNEFFKHIELAQQAEAAGNATDKQTALLQEERMRVAEEKAKEEQRTMNKMKKALFGDLAEEDTAGGRLAKALQKASKPESNLGGTAQEIGEGIGISHAVDETAAKAAQTDMSGRNPQMIGSSLDQLGANVAQAATSTSRSWTSWITGR